MTQIQIFIYKLPLQLRAPIPTAFWQFCPMSHSYFKRNMSKIQMYHLGPGKLLPANLFHAIRTRKNLTTNTCWGTDDPFMWLWFKYLLWLLNFKITLKKPSQVSINKEGDKGAPEIKNISKSS